MSIFINFRLFKNLRKKEVVRKGHEAPTREEGAPPIGCAPCLMGTSCASRTPFSCMLRILVSKNSLYILPKVLTTVSRKYPLFSFRVVPAAELNKMSSQDSKGESYIADYIANPKVYGDVEHYGWTTEEEEDYDPKRKEETSSDEEEDPLPQPSDMHVEFKKSSLPKVQSIHHVFCRTTR